MTRKLQKIATIALASAVIAAAGTATILAAKKCYRACVKETLVSYLRPGRAKILDRNGLVLAETVFAPSLFVDRNWDAKNTSAHIDELATIFPEIDKDRLTTALSKNAPFVWLKRHVSTSERDAVLAKDIPGVQLKWELARSYISPNGLIQSVGSVDVDNNGLTGIEKGLDRQLKDSSKPLALSLDYELQTRVQTALKMAVAEFKTTSGSAIVLNPATGEILSLISEPEYRYSLPMFAVLPRATAGVFEMRGYAQLLGATLMAESGLGDVSSISRFLSAAADLEFEQGRDLEDKMFPIGPDLPRTFFAQLGLLEQLTLEIPETSKPMIKLRKSHYDGVLDRNIGTAEIPLISGQGLAASPLSFASAIGAIVNDGVLVSPTLLKRQGSSSSVVAKRAIALDAAHIITSQMRNNSRSLFGIADESMSWSSIDGVVINGEYNDDVVNASFLIAAKGELGLRLVYVGLFHLPSGNEEADRKKNPAQETAHSIMGLVLDRDKNE